MQTLVQGYVLSLALWAVLVIVSLAGARRLHRDGALGEKWFLLAPFAFASLLFYGIRFRFAFWFLGRQAVHELFAIGAYWEADRFVLLLCLPLFYVISVLKPDWVVRAKVSVPLLVLAPFALKLGFFLTGLAAWELHPGQVMPVRVD